MLSVEKCLCLFVMLRTGRTRATLASTEAAPFLAGRRLSSVAVANFRAKRLPGRMSPRNCHDR